MQKITIFSRKKYFIFFYRKKLLHDKILGAVMNGCIFDWFPVESRFSRFDFLLVAMEFSEFLLKTDSYSYKKCPIVKPNFIFTHVSEHSKHFEKCTFFMEGKGGGGCDVILVRQPFFEDCLESPNSNPIWNVITLI